MLGGARFRWLIALALLGATALAEPTVAWADRVTELTQTLSSSNTKARLAAAVALGKLGDRRAVQPLVSALADSDAQIRTVAAAALGKLGYKAALPALKDTALTDGDDRVRRSARAAATTVAKANRLPSPWPEVTVTAAAIPPRGSFGNQPRGIGPAPDLFVLVNSSADDSPGTADKETRRANADLIRRVLIDQCKSNPVITTVASDAKRLGLDTRNIDLSVVKMEVTTSGGMIEVAAHLRLAISDESGKMLSFLSGGAKVQVPKRNFDARYLANLRRDALENAMRGMFDKLLAHLRERPTI